MATFVSVNELKERADALIAQVAGGGEQVVITDGERRLAILTPHGGPLRDRAIDKAELGFDLAAGLAGTPAGRELLGHELAEAGIPLAKGATELDAIYSAVLSLCEDKEQVFREDVRAVAEEVLADAPGRLRLLALTIQTTTGMPATAEVTLQLDDGPAMRRQQGDGPLDAAFKAIEKLTGQAAAVESFAAFSATPGRDAMAEAVVELSIGERIVTGRGASTDSVTAGVHAYLHALNYLTALER
ncbi:MAG TPA: alpha-isopropylmalate synthase regulatory domain-containing protein [Candidatus Dormibacteraeota bacterium]|nr:alpha-isopropylmalate synthase regulatory domain-containing protein [Candidatus Dormibacteraeota bacterium]